MKPAPEPASFCEKVRIPGWRSLFEKCGRTAPAPLERTEGRRFEHVKIKVTDSTGQEYQRVVTEPEEIPGGKLEPYWTSSLSDLLVAYERICAYSGHRIHETAPPTVDHMVAKSHAWNRVYEWDNYRLASWRMNTVKREFSDVIDPFEVRPGWFALDLTFGEVKPGPAARSDSGLHVRVTATIQRLGLNDRDLCEARVRDIEAYEQRAVIWSKLVEESRFVAAEIERQGKRRAW